MALIGCPECRREVSSFAFVCPRCGYPIANDPMNAFDVFNVLLASANDGIRRGVASNPSTPPELLSKLAEEQWYDPICQRVASNPSTPPDALALLAGSENYSVLRSVAENPSTPPEELAWLAEPNEHHDKSFREYVASNPSAPPLLLAELARDSDANVQKRAAKNPSTPPHVLTEPAKENHFVQQRVALNPSAPPETLAKLICNGGWGIEERLAANPSTPPEALAALAKENHHNRMILMLVASNPSTPTSTLKELSECREDVLFQDDGVLEYWDEDQDEDWEDIPEVFGYTIRQCVASNPSTPPETLAMLAKDYDDSLMEYVAANPSTPPETLLDMLSAYYAVVENADEFNEELEDDDCLEKSVSHAANAAGIAAGNPSIIKLRAPEYHQRICALLSVGESGQNSQSTP